MVYKACQEPDFARDFGLKDQIQRAAVSIMANIAEGFERKGDKEFIYFLRIARGSCAEVQSHLYVALDVGLIDQDRFDCLQEAASTTGRKISGFLRYLGASNN